MPNPKIDWRTQLIGHGLKTFYAHGTVGGVITGELIYDFITEVEPFDFDPMVKNILWGKAKAEFNKECKARIKYMPEAQIKELRVRYYKRHLVNKRLADLLQKGQYVQIDIKLIDFTI
jgi:hypothetical protein